MGDLDVRGGVAGGGLHGLPPAVPLVGRRGTAARRAMRSRCAGRLPWVAGRPRGPRRCRVIRRGGGPAGRDREVRRRSAPSPSPSARGLGPAASGSGPRGRRTRPPAQHGGCPRQGSACGDSVDPCPRHGAGRRLAVSGERLRRPDRGRATYARRAARRMAAPLRPDRGPRAGRGLARCPDRSGDRPAGSDTGVRPSGTAVAATAVPEGGRAADGPSPLTSRHVSRGHEARGAAPDAAEPTHTPGRQGPLGIPTPARAPGRARAGHTGPQHTSRGAKPAPRAPLAQPR